jgi:hypothetical protein
LSRITIAGVLTAALLAAAPAAGAAPVTPPRAESFMDYTDDACVTGDTTRRPLATKSGGEVCPDF